MMYSFICIYLCLFVFIYLCVFTYLFMSNLKMNIRVYLVRLFDSTSQSAFTRSKLTIETQEQGAKYIQS